MKIDDQTLSDLMEKHVNCEHKEGLAYGHAVAAACVPQITHQDVWSAFNMCPDSVVSTPARMRWMASHINQLLKARE